MKGSEEFIAGEGLSGLHGRTVSVMSGLLDDDYSWLGQVRGDRKVRE